MSDAHANSPENQDEPEIEEAEAPEADAEIEEPEADAPDEPEAEPEDDGAEPEQETSGRREARGQPSREHRDRRLSEQERIDRAVEREVERRLQGNSRPAVDYQQQQREQQAQRARELDEARLAGNEAEVRERHMRQDFEAGLRARDIRDTNQRLQDRFDRLCDRNPIYDGIRNDVEREASRLRNQGVFTPDLELIANNILGRKYAERASRQGTQQRRNADRETKRQTVRPPRNSGSEQPAPRRSGRRAFNELSVQEMEDQLANIPVRSGSSS